MRETLYTKDKKDKIRVFRGEVGDVGLNATIYTYTGLLNGNLIEKKTHITKGKQGRTIEEQANFELNSLYGCKLDEGYKSFEMLVEKGRTFGMISETDKELINNLTVEDTETLQYLFKQGFARYNTNRHWLPLPMLADKYKGKLEGRALVQPKLNGVRCLALWSQADGKVILLSRGGQFYSLPHIEAALHPILIANKNLILDGELYKHGTPLQQISGAVRKEDKDLFSEPTWLEYHIYDSAMYNTSNFDRWQLTQTNYRAYYLSDVIPGGTLKEILKKPEGPIQLVTTVIVETHEHLKALHDGWVQMGFEGAIIRPDRKDAWYTFGFRSDSIQKMKEFLDEEFEIVGCEADNTTHQSIGESFVFILLNNQGPMISKEALIESGKHTFKARPTGTLAQKCKWYSSMDLLIGTKATVRFQERSESGLPIQGHVRSNTIEIESLRNYE